MDSELIDPDFLAAQALKVSILRLEHCHNLHHDDIHYHEASLVLLLGRLNTPESRQAFVDLFEFQLNDSVFNAIGAIADEYKKDLIPVMRARIGQPLCPQAQRSPDYGRGAVSREQRDELLQEWLTDMTNGS